MSHAEQVVLLYFNDAHEVAPVVDEMGERGGVARLKATVDSVRAKHPDAKLLFGGDLAGGVLFGAVFHGFPVVEALNRIGVDAATFGQHDFDFGAENTRELVEASNFPWFTGNLTESDGSPFHQLPRTLVLEHGSLRIGLIGLTDDMHTTKQEGIVVQENLLEAAGRSIDALEGRADILIAMTQTRLEVNERLLLTYPAIDAIYSEERYENRTAVHFVGDRPILTPGGNIASLARLDITFEENDRRLQTSAIPIDASTPADPELTGLEKRYMERLEVELARPVATLETDLSTGMYTNNRARWGETTAGNVIADAFRDQVQAEIGLIQGGGIRSNINAGVLTMRDLLALLPFGNTVVKVRLPGAAVIDALEHGVAKVEDREGRFLQVSGIQYTYDPGRSRGDRIVSVTRDGEPINLEKMYTIALPSYLYTGGDGFDMFSTGELLVAPKEGMKDVEALREYALDHGTLAPRLEGRITALSQN
ncbi:hypothetical protein GF324_11170 [bacterium]|nr:hypothetical protein [bacterium]